MRTFMALFILVLSVFAVSVYAQSGGVSEPIIAEPNDTVDPAFDITAVQVHKLGSTYYFQQEVVGEAGSEMPEAIGDLAGAGVYSYVWPTSLDSSVVGFEAEQGILALVVTVHPDFDDTPHWDENEDGDTSNDGGLWHSHWVVLVPDDACEAGLKVQDIPEDAEPQLPETAPGLPLLIDSPNYMVELIENEVVVAVPYDQMHQHTDDHHHFDSFNYDGVTADLHVNPELRAPLLCVTHVHDIASGDLSLPGIAQ